MTEKRFEINNDMNLDDKVETYELSCIVDNDNKTFYFVVDSIANVESFVERLNELHEENEQLRKEKECDKQVFTKKQLHERLQQTRKENEQLKQAIAETEKMVQSTYDELTRLRCFKKNIIRIKHSWDYLMEAIQYD